MNQSDKAEHYAQMKMAEILNDNAFMMSGMGPEVIERALVAAVRYGQALNAGREKREEIRLETT